jgi:CheY-like chemotaxis protein
VIALSGLASQSHRRQVEEAGFDRFLSKPFDAATLAKAIAAVLDPRLRARAS